MKIQNIICIYSKIYLHMYNVFHILIKIKHKVTPLASSVGEGAGHHTQALCYNIQKALYKIRINHAVSTQYSCKPFTFNVGDMIFNE
jgi:hypothetical protein